MRVDYLDKAFQSEIVKEFAVMPNRDIVVRLEGGESLWFNSKGEHPKSRLVIGEGEMRDKELPHLSAIATQDEMADAIRAYRRELEMCGHKPTPQDSRRAIAYLQHAKTIKYLKLLLQPKV